jgi:ribosomal protein L44E
MDCCRVCGEEKIKREFIRIKHFRFIKSERVIWCRDCQRLYKRKLELEAKKKKLEEMEGVFIVVFS